MYTLYNNYYYSQAIISCGEGSALKVHSLYYVHVHIVLIYIYMYM